MHAKQLAICTNGTFESTAMVAPAIPLEINSDRVFIIFLSLRKPSIEICVTIIINLDKNTPPDHALRHTVFTILESYTPSFL
jgi:hypothetical protein